MICTVGFNSQINNLINIANAKKYDLIITGDILYYFEGGNYESSHIEEEIRVIRVNDKIAQTLWHAGAVEIGLPTPYTDSIFEQRDGFPAPAAKALIKRNAKKFCNLFLSASFDRQPVPKSTSYRRPSVPKSTNPTTQLFPKSTLKGYSRPVSGYKKAGVNPQDKPGPIEIEGPPDQAG